MSSDTKDHPRLSRLLDELQDRFEIRLDSRQIDAMEQYWTLLSKWKRRLSLTTIGSYAELLEFHFFEAFFAADRLLGPEEAGLADIGSGAGFPGLAFSVFSPALEVRLLESNHRKAVFLTQALRECGLEGGVECTRAEEFSGWRDVQAASIRALKTGASLEILLRTARIPLLALHGKDLPVSGETGVEVEERLRIPGTRSRYASRLRFR